MIEMFLTSGHIIYLILALLGLEVLVLRKYFNRAPAMLWSLCAGGAMALALWAALTAQSLLLIAIFLSMSLVFHILEVRQWLTLVKRLPQ